MKKLFSVIAIVAVIGAFSSCKPKEKCPAYGKMTPEKTSKEAHI